MRTGKFIIGILLLCCFIRMVTGSHILCLRGAWSRRCFAEIRLWINKLAYGGRFPSRWADIPLLNVFTWIRPLRLADEENHWEYRRLPGYSEPKQGDIAVFNSPVDPQLLLVKRITRVVKKGEPLRIDRRTLLLYRSLILRDGGKVMEKDGKYISWERASSQYIPKQRFYYMEGDNRMNSHDSRSFGFISEEAIIGKFDFVLFSIVPKSKVESNSFATNDDAVSLRFKRSSCRYGWLNHNPARTAARIYINIYNFQ